MKPETIALHAGFDSDPTTKAVAVPIYQTVAYSFDSAAHGAALFDLEVEGYRYTRIGNPTTTVLERRVAELEGGIDALAVALRPDRPVLHRCSTSPSSGQNIVSVPQLYGTTHTLFAHILPKFGVQARFGKSDRPADLEKLIDANTRALFCETVGNPAGNICDLEALAAITRRAPHPADRRQHRADADPDPPLRVRRRHRGALAHQVPGRPRHDAGRRHRRQRQLPLGGRACALPELQHAGRLLSRPGLHRALREEGLSRSRAQRLPAHHGRGALPVQRVPAAAGHRDRGAARRAARREREEGGGIPARRPAGRLRQLRRLPRQSLLPARAEVPRRPRLLAHDLRHPRRLRRPASASTTHCACSSAW